MKEKIYTIPINEAIDADCECPLCFIEKRLEAEAVEYELGPAMMEPDHRELSNRKGYCRKHLEMMLKTPNKLPLALILDTHLEEVRKELGAAKNGVKKRGIFKKEAKGTALSEIVASCVICEKIEKTMDRYCNVLVAMWEEDEVFKEKLRSSKGFCLPHFEKLYAMSKSSNFLTALLEKEGEVLEALNSDVHKFTLKFDYRNRDMEWGTAKDAPKRAADKIVGYIRETDGEHGI